MGLILINTSIFRRVKPPWFKTVEDKTVEIRKNTVSYSLDENLYFCDKIIKSGYKIVVDTGIQAVHYDVNKDMFYFNSEGIPVAIRNSTYINYCGDN